MDCVSESLNSSSLTPGAGFVSGSFCAPPAGPTGPIPLELERLAELPRHREIVAYCRGPFCVLAVEAVKQLRTRGFKALRLEDGIPDWRAQGFRVAVGEQP